MTYKNQKKKKMTITYKNEQYQVVDIPDLNEFSGFEIIKERDKVSYIKEYLYGEEVTKISFRSTMEPIIFTVKMGNYSEERYSNNSICTKYHLANETLYGEYIRYTSSGKVQDVRFYNNGQNCTDELRSFINFNDTDEAFFHYEFTEEEQFNIIMKYGANFRFLHEYEVDSSRFDNIVRECLK